MAAFINTNLAALNTQRNLSASQAALGASIQRLSSGMRVNSAKDDAAGLAIASRMDSAIRGQTVAMRNANDAISFSQTAEGALGKITDNLQRMRELAVQAANGTNTRSDRRLLNTEFGQLQSEVARISNSAEFNGISVLDGAPHVFQIGSDSDSNSQIAIAGVDITAATSETGKAATATSATAWNTFITAYDAFAAAGGQFNQDTSAGIKGPTTTDADLATYTAALDTYKAAGGITLFGRLTSKVAINQIDKALKEVSNEAIKNGAYQNRFSAVVSTLQVSVENQTAARSRIIDTDFAAETTTMARHQILQQAGMAMLAQANQLPSGVMALLR
jgi:flagellin